MKRHFGKWLTAAALAVGDLLTARYGEGWMIRPDAYREEDAPWNTV